MNLSEKVLNERLQILEDLKREIVESADSQNKTLDEAIEEMKKDPVKLKAWQEGAEAVIQKIRSEKGIGELDTPESEDPEILSEMCKEELSTDIGVYHKRYSKENLENELYKKSEEEAYQYALENPYVVYWYGSNFSITVRAE